MQKQYNLTPEQEQRAAELRNMSPDAYEKLCKGCGLCCLCKTGTEVFQIALAVRISCRGFHSAQCRQKHRRKNGNNRNDHQKFDQGKIAVCFVIVSLPPEHLFHHPVLSV